MVLLAALGLAAALRPYARPPSLQQQVMAIAADVRCPECEGESVADSDAAASLAIRAEIARDLLAGQNRAQILREIAAEYGQWILYRPPLHGGFLLLWLAPVLGLLGAAAVLARWRPARRSRSTADASSSGSATRADGAAQGQEEVWARLQRYL